MTRPSLPPIQGKRFDIETLQYHALGLARQADKGPTFLRHHGRIAYVVMSEAVFDEVWPDPHRAWGVNEMPQRHEQMLLDALEEVLAEPGDEGQ